MWSIEHEHEQNWYTEKNKEKVEQTCMQRREHLLPFSKNYKEHWLIEKKKKWNYDDN